MMHSNELRLGNWLMGSGPVQVTRIFDENNVGIGSGDPYAVYAEEPFKPCLKPILISKEWLLKFGFDYKGIDTLGGWETFYLNGVTIKFGAAGGLHFHHGQTITIANYIHEIQNLHFALTGSELITK